MRFCQISIICSAIHYPHRTSNILLHLCNIGACAVPVKLEIYHSNLPTVGEATDSQRSYSACCSYSCQVNPRPASDQAQRNRNACKHWSQYCWTSVSSLLVCGRPHACCVWSLSAVHRRSFVIASVQPCVLLAGISVSVRSACNRAKDLGCYSLGNFSRPLGFRGRGNLTSSA
jgi:hypothetical protein